MDQLIFEVINITTGQHYKIYESGKVEGFGSPEDRINITNWAAINMVNAKQLLKDYYLTKK